MSGVFTKSKEKLGAWEQSCRGSPKQSQALWKTQRLVVTCEAISNKTQQPAHTVEVAVGSNLTINKNAHWFFRAKGGENK